MHGGEMMKKDIHYINDLLRQYREGSISDQDRHALEKIALDDPMIFDAMEGYTLNVTSEQHASSIDKLKSKTAPSPSPRLVNMRVVSIAAGLLILVGALSWVNSQFDTQNDAAISQSEVKVEQSAPIAIEESKEDVESDTVGDFVGIKVGDLQGNAVPTELLNENDEMVDDVVVSATKSTHPKIKESQESSKEQAEEPIEVETVSETFYLSDATDSETVDSSYEYGWASPSTMLSEKPQPTIAQNEMPTAVPANTRDESVLMDRSSKRKKETVVFNNGIPSPSRLNNKIIQGRVRDITGEPLIGATIVTADGITGAATDIDGAFEIEIDSLQNELLISYTGYSDLVMALDSSSNYDLVLEEGMALDEVVVTGYGSNYNARNQEPAFVLPPGGRSDFKKKIAAATENNPCDEKGKVRLLFIVDKYGQVSDFQIKRSLSESCDKMAIQIIRDAGTWDNQTNKNKKVRYTITF